MAYVEPNSVADFFYNTGLSMSHENTLYFSTAPLKDQYFAEWSKVSVDHVTYQRENRGWIRVELPMSRLYNVDYMRFRNVSFENHYFYAFVTAINYINNVTTEVQYVLDPIMTWMGIFGLKQCYIERQHTTNDGIGNNIAEEGIPVGNYITELQTTLAQFNYSNSFARIAKGNEAGTNLMGGIYSGSSIIDCDSQSELNSAIANLIDNDQADSIVSITMIPNGVKGGSVVSTTQDALPKPYSTVGGYTPRNKKLFCYPYKYCTIDNGEGSTIDLMYEYFGTIPDATSSGNLSFTIAGCGYPSGAEYVIYPNNYKDNSGLEYRLTMTHFPVCSFAVNSYEAYLAQKNAYFPLTVARQNAQSLVQMGSAGAKGAFNGLRSGGLLGSLVGGISGAANAGIEGVASQESLIRDNLVINSIRPESPTIEHGTPSSDIMWSIGNKSFMIYEKTITKNYAMMIDSYFDMFGYAVKQHGTPNMNARPHWTYCKTTGCDVTGNLPAQDKREIEAIFDNGVRFWHNLLEMGNYSLDNSPS